MFLTERQEKWTPAAAAVFGLFAGICWTMVAAELSPLKSVAIPLGLGVVVVVLLNPALGFGLTALVIPLERLGRFTADSSMYTLSLMRVVGVLALGSFLLHALVRRWQLNFGTAFFLYAAYFGLALLGVVHTSDPLGTVRACGAIVGNLLFFFLVINVVREWRLARSAVMLWLVATTLAGVYVIYDWHLGQSVVASESGIGDTDTRTSTVWSDTSEWESLDQVKRAMGTTSHAAVYGINLILSIPFFLFFIRTESDWRFVALALGAVGIVLYNVMLTNTRAAILLAVLVLGLAMVRGLLRIRPAWIFGAVLTGLLLAPAVPRAIYERVLDLSNYSYERSATLRIRMEYWQAGLRVIEENWLTGVGVGNQSEIPKYIRGHGPKQTTVHNEYIQTFLEVGVFGFLAFFGFVALLMWRAIAAGRMFRRVGTDDDRYWFMVASQIAMISVLIYGLQVDVFHFPLKGWWLVGALAWVMYGIARHETPDEAREVT